jgi:hypothetical protein
LQVFKYPDSRTPQMQSFTGQIEDPRVKESMRVFRYMLLVIALFAIPASSFAGVFVSVNVAPPMLPVYDQPLCPGDGYIWTPGYWAYGDDGYFWVPGTWVLAPYTGALWTPGYWGFGDGGLYLWHGGYWGLHIGFYGGVNYGYGYFGRGYEGGYWNHGAFTYNRSINHLDMGRVHNVYDHNVRVENNSRVAFNGGNGGVRAEASPQERIAEHEQHIASVPLQQQHMQAAAGNRAQYANVNHGQPAVAATARPGRQGFQQAMTHPDNPQAVQAARTAPAGNRSFQNNRPANNSQPQNFSRSAPQQQSRPAPQQQQSRPAPQQQSRPAPSNNGSGGGGHTDNRHQ